MKININRFLISLAFAVGAYTYYKATKSVPTLQVLKPPIEGYVDSIFVDKSDRILRLIQNDNVVREYKIALGDNPVGHKQQEGDERTPTGNYIIDWRNPNSIAHLSLHISYPNEDDKARAAELGVSPGGNIMIHGIANGWGHIGAQHIRMDWTDGCIAVTNEEMDEIWAHVANGTPIEIQE